MTSRINGMITHTHTSMFLFLKKNSIASRPSEHTPSQGEKIKTFWWDNRLQIQNLFMPFKRVSRWYNTEEKPTVMLYTYIINRHAGTPDKNKTKTF